MAKELGEVDGIAVVDGAENQCNQASSPGYRVARVDFLDRPGWNCCPAVSEDE